MPVAHRITISATIAGVPINSTINRTTVGNAGHSPEIPAAKAGTLTTRTDNDTGTLTLGASHGVQTGDKLDVYWSGGRRYGMTAGTVAGTSVPIDGGTGDNLPVATTAITCQVPQSLDVDFDGDLVEAFAVKASDTARVEFYAGASLVLGLDLVANEAWWWIDGQSTNPLAGQDITVVKMTHASSSAAARVSLGIALNSLL